MITSEEGGDVIAAMSRHQTVAALVVLSVRHPEVFADVVAWAMESDARTARYVARQEAKVGA